MKSLLCLLFFFSYSLAKAQIVPHQYSGDSALMLLADNGRHNRLYGNKRTLKIRYPFDGQIIKAKGKSVIKNRETVQLELFGYRDIVIIPVDSIISVRPWHHTEKISTIVAAGTGITTFLAAALIQQPYRPGVAEINIPQFALLFVSEAAFWSAVLMLPVDFLGEWLFIRSEKKGYHFLLKKFRWEKVFGEIGWFRGNFRSAHP